MREKSCQKVDEKEQEKMKKMRENWGSKSVPEKVKFSVCWPSTSDFLFEIFSFFFSCHFFYSILFTFFFLIIQPYVGHMQPMLLAKIIVNRDCNRFLIGHLFIILRNDTHLDDNRLRENQIFLIAGQINDKIAVVKVSNF